METLPDLVREDLRTDLEAVIAIDPNFLGLYFQHMHERIVVWPNQHDKEWLLSEQLTIAKLCTKFIDWYEEQE